MMKLHEQVKQLEEEYEALGSLCGEMIATLTLAKNKLCVHPKLLDLAECWSKRYLTITEDP